MKGRQKPKSKYLIYNPDSLKYIIHGHNPRLPRVSTVSRLSRLPILNIVSLLMSLFIAVQLL